MTLQIAVTPLRTDAQPATIPYVAPPVAEPAGTLVADNSANPWALMGPAPAASMAPVAVPAAGMPAAAPAADPWALMAPAPTAASAPAAPAYTPSAAGPVYDAAGAFANSAVNAIPIIGPTLTSWGNNVDAGINNALAPVFGFQPETPQDRAQLDQAQQQQYPIASTAGTVAGTVVPFVLAGGTPAAGMLGMAGGLGARMGAGAASSAIIGGADAIARGQFPQEAVGTGIADGVIGGGVPVVGHVAGAIGGNIVNSLRGSANDATALIRNALMGDTNAGANIAAGGRGAMVADAGPNTAGLLDLAIQRSGPGSTAARAAIEGRAVDANDQIAQAMLKHLGTPTGVATLSQDLRAATQPAISKAYRAAYDAPIDFASDEGKQLAEVFDRVPTSVKNNAAAMMRMEGIDPMTEAPPTRQNLVINDDGTYSLPEQPSLQMIDYTKRALQDAADREQGMGAMGGITNKGRILQGLSADLRDSAVGVVPEYGHALSLASDPITARSAALFGNRLLSAAVPMDVVQMRIAAMTPADIRSLKTGLASHINEVVANVRQVASDPNLDARQANAALSMLSSGAAREKMAMIPGLDIADLTKELDEAGRAMQLRANTATNSKTFTRLAADEILNDSMNTGPINAIRKGKPIDAAQAIVQAMLGASPKAQAAYKAQVYGQVADALTRQRGAVAQAYATKLQTTQPYWPIAQAMISRAIAPADVPLLVNRPHPSIAAAMMSQGM